MAQQPQRPGIGPVQVVQDQDERPCGGRLLDERAQRLEGHVALGGPALVRPGHPHARQQPHERSAARRQPRLALGCRQRRQVALERLDERLVGKERLLVAAAVQDRRAGRVRTPAELADERRLADPGLPGDQREPQRPRPRVLPRRRQAPQRVLPTDRPHRAGERRRQRGMDGCRARGRSATSAPGLLDQRPRLRRRSDAELALQPSRERARGGERGGTIAGRGQQADKLAVRALRQRLDLEPPPRPGDRLRELARALRPLGQRTQAAGQLRRVLVAGAQHPVGVEPRQQLRTAQPHRRLKVAGGTQTGELASVHPHVRIVQPDGIAADRQGRRGAGSQGAPKLVDRGAQRLAGALLGNVGAQRPRKRRAAVRAGMQRQPGQQLPRAGVRGQRKRRAVRADLQSAERSDVEHARKRNRARTRSGRAADGRPDAARTRHGDGAQPPSTRSTRSSA